jgi:hypothetical protein
VTRKSGFYLKFLIRRVWTKLREEISAILVRMLDANIKYLLALKALTVGDKKGRWAKTRGDVTGDY